VSSEAPALAWAREGGPAGAVVLADFQLAARGRAGLEWDIDAERDLAFSLVLRPSLAPQRDAWPYVVGTVAVTDVLGGDPEIRWPDEVRVAGARAAVVGTQVDAGPTRAAWVVVSVWVLDPGTPRAPLLAATVDAVERRLAQPPQELLADHRRLCVTLGRRVRVRMSGLGAGETIFTGVARSVLKDGALIVEGDKGRQMVPPSYLRVIEHLDAPGG
jgi:BirA family biotin operon repressor/biotin-[acetyl-CoA-carboxylase] ligase